MGSLQIGARFCPSCGTRQGNQTKTCSCGSQIAAGTKFCSSCGTRVGGGGGGYKASSSTAPRPNISPSHTPPARHHKTWAQARCAGCGGLLSGKPSRTVVAQTWHEACWQRLGGS